ncbi:hypothetical protein [Rugosimonospora africana]|uniref:Uncharacterized protein n=1 Tax=Rugosimonospora africana TaxID=556532 RepID=A0A8J3VSX5_9ACTN|nr:hypothetical protein [Rugosimonospora africana]GIH17066.1 hypothetical protein Raf01_52380 [Rugosimonospora africana]
MADRDVTIDILGRDRTGASTRSATRNYQQLQRATKDTDTQTSKLQKRVEAWGKSALSAAKSTVTLAGKVAAFGSLIGPATTGTIAAAKGVVAFGKAAAAAAGEMAPLVAFIPSLVGSLGLLVGTTRLIGPGLARALQPVTSQFVAADGGTTKLTAHLQQLASKGVTPLAKEFVKVNLPSISKGMGDIAVAENSVVVGVAKWINSTPGQKLIRGITQDTATAAGVLAPHVTAAAIAFGNLAARASSGKFTSLSKVVGGLADKFTAWANSVSSQDISGSLDRIDTGLDRLKTGWDKVKEFGSWLAGLEPKVKAFSNTLAVVGLTVSVAAGEWPAAAAAGFTLVANNWDKAKGVLVSVGKWFDSSGLTAKFQSLYQYFKPGVVNNWKTAWADLVQAFHHNEPQIKQVIGDVGALTGAAITLTPYILNVGSGFLIAVGQVTRAVDGIVSVTLAGFGLIVNAAATSFGWIPGIGPKLKKAQADFNAFRDSVNGALAGIKDKTVTIHAIVTGNGARFIENNGSVLAVGNSNRRAFAADASWQPAVTAAQFRAQNGPDGSDQVGTSRTGGPAPTHVESNVTSNLYLDGRLVYSYTDRAINRERWRQRMKRI